MAAQSRVSLNQGNVTGRDLGPSAGFATLAPVSYTHLDVYKRQGVGHVQRMPDYWELFSPNNGPLGAANAFAGVQSGKTTQLDIGAQWHGKRSNAWVSAYAGRIQDLSLIHI